MNMSSFVLTPIDSRGWQGTSGKAVNLSVQSIPSTAASVSITAAAYSGANPSALTPSGSTVTLTLAKGPHAVTIDVTRNVPPVDWAVLEVDVAGNTQVLKTVQASLSMNDPYSVGILLNGQ
jgi:hypothetical protein